MRKILIVVIAFLLFWISYQIRTAYLATYDYNEPSDANEYLKAANGIYGFIEDAKSGKISFPYITPHSIITLNTHGTPFYISYLVLLNYINVTHELAAIILSSVFVVILFFISIFFLPLWVGIIVGIIASVYTPLFSTSYSWMPESFTTTIVPTLMIGTCFLIRGKKYRAFLLAGIFLAFIGFSRHVFSLYGFFFILIYLLYQKLVNKKRIEKLKLVLLILGYIVPLFIWQGILIWSGDRQYTQGVVESGVYFANRLETDGWTLDNKKITWLEVIRETMLQKNLLTLPLLKLERVIRFFQNPANAYSTSFPFPNQDMLRYFHIVILFFAAWGIRAILRNIFLLLISSLLFWNTLAITSYYLEETRLQLPTVGIVILFAGLGIHEFFKLLRSKARSPVIIITILFFIWLTFRSIFLGVEMFFIPIISDAYFWRAINIILVTSIMLVVTKRFWRYDQNMRIISFIPFFVFILLLAVHLRSEIWHEWYAPLFAHQKIEQNIVLSASQVKDLKEKQGYLLIDIQDPGGVKNLSIHLNDKILEERLPINKHYSPIDLLAIRQWQRTLPRIGWGRLEEHVASAPAWANMRQWLVVPIQGNSLKKENIVTVENTGDFAFSPPLVFGDYLLYDSSKYEGPTARLFQGPKIFNKYQIDGDFRLNERRLLNSVRNESRFILADNQEYKNDLSLLFGTQKGRYRIFFLFPYKVLDPEDIF